MQNFFLNSPKLDMVRETLVYVFLGCLDPTPPVAKTWNDFALYMETYGQAIIRMNEDLYMAYITRNGGDCE